MTTPAPSWRAALVSGGILMAGIVSAQTATPTPAAPPPPLKDADGRSLRRAPTGHITNYYEEKVPAYTLPDPLVLKSGAPVRDAATWFRQRRPELLQDYEREIYGRVPAGAPKVSFEVKEKDVPALEGAATRKQVILHFGEGPKAVAANFMVYLPAKATGPVPLVLHISFGGDAALPPPPLPPGAPPGTQPRRFNDMGPAADIIARGYGYAIVRYAEMQPDRAGTKTEGIMGLALPAGATEPAPDEWGTIAVWAWGLGRFMDYLQTDPAVDAKRVALVGHSRLGKTVLWAGATDPRFALIYSSQSGEMGAALSRRDFGETVDDMAANFGYQFAGNFQKYPGKWSEMPHEGHLLISLSAPRPVLVTAADGDMWSDPRGQFLAMVAAGPVWRLLGKPDLGTTEPPALDSPVASGTLAYLENKGGHVVSKLDWQTLLDFADRQLGK
ncbi:MAG TPA: acetylxylan esterase [Lacunisphaera sp.]|nr:acetylxylan esterase [Lacunisphaera sp.]